MSGAGYGRLADLALAIINLAGISYTILRAGWTAGLCWTAVVVLHEVGHAAVAKFLGAKIVRVLVVPYVGGVTIGLVRAGLDGTACFILGGVALSSLAALGLLSIASAVGGTAGLWMAAFAGLMAWVNLLNLIPVSPLDGGRLLVLVTRAWKPWIGRLVQGGMLALLTYLAVRTGAWLLWVIVAITGPLFLLEVYLRVRFRSSAGDEKSAGSGALVWLGIYLLEVALLMGTFAASFGKAGVASRISALLPF